VISSKKEFSLAFRKGNSPHASSTGKMTITKNTKKHKQLWWFKTKNKKFIGLWFLSDLAV
jgi:hypothetical protein